MSKNYKKEGLTSLFLMLILGISIIVIASISNKNSYNIRSDAQIPEDKNPPELKSLEISPKVVNIDNGDSCVDFTMHLTDETGISDGFTSSATQFALLSPKDWEQSMNVSFPAENIVSGDKKDGVVKNTVCFSPYNMSGTWRIDYFSMTDELGNNRGYFTDELKALGYPVTVDMYSSKSDTKAPEILSLDFPIKTKSRYIKVTTRLKDLGSGVSTGYNNHHPSHARFTAPDGRSVDAVFEEGYRVSGDDKDGVYVYEMVLPEGLYGKWNVQYITANDMVGNSRTIETKQLSKSKLSKSFVYSK